MKHYNEPGIKKLFTERAGEKKENFSVLEMDEHTVFIGDIYQLGKQRFKYLSLASYRRRKWKTA